MHVTLPEKVPLLTIDTSWTKLEKIAPNALANLTPAGQIIALLKPHYQAAPKQLRKGKLAEEFLPEIISQTKSVIEQLGLTVVAQTDSPIVGGKGGNKEILWLLKPA